MALTTEQQVKMRNLAAEIWGQSVADGLNINDDVVNVITNASREILICANRMASLEVLGVTALMKIKIFIERPLNPAEQARIIMDYADAILGIFQRTAVNQSSRSCIVTVAANYRSPLEIASLGL